MLLAAIAALSLALEPSLVRVEGESDCPTIDDVRAALGRLSSQDRRTPGSTPAGDIDVAVLRATSGRLHVELHRPDGTLVGEKDLETRTHCDELAEAVAVVITAWELQFRFDSTSQTIALPPPPPWPEPRRGSERTAIAAPPPLPLPPPLPSTPAVEAPSPVTQRRATWRPELGLGLSVVVPSPRPGARLHLLVRNDDTPWLGHLLIGGSTWHSTNLAAGTGKWTRVFGGLGCGYAWQGARLAAQLEANVLGAATLASAEDFGAGWAVRRRTAFEAGVGVALRLLGFRRSRLGAWLALESAFWPRGQALSATDQNGNQLSHVDLPRFELSLVAGGSLRGPL